MAIMLSMESMRQYCLMLSMESMKQYCLGKNHPAAIGSRVKCSKTALAPVLAAAQKQRIAYLT
ncbi:MAG: hypothetical protein ACLUNQ_07250 [Oscillospiraceae bacterium]